MAGTRNLERDRAFHDETAAIHHGRRPEPRTGAVVPPIFQSTTFAQPRVGEDLGFTYSRVDNPTVRALEEALAAYEGMASATAYATGMAATTCLALALLDAGSHAVIGDVVYGGTARLFTRVLARFGVRFTFVDASQAEAVAAALRPETRLILVETPANPTLKLVDLEAVARVARGAGVPLVVDNTFLTAALQRPAACGADVVLYSTTKFIEGHNSTVGGAVVVDDRELDERLRLVRKTTGSIQSPFDAWLTLQGLKTLPLRMQRHSDSALVAARFLSSRPEVRAVHYPFLPTFPQVDLARRQQRAGGGILAFELVGGAAAARTLLASVECLTLAENLGAVESLVTHPATMTHADVDPELRAATGITDGLVRLSVGLEHVDDIVGDLDRGLLAARRSEASA